MPMDLIDIPGYELFETKTEQERLIYLFKFANIEELFPSERIKYLIPNMVRDPEGKTRTIGAFVILDTVIFEFHNFLNEIYFDCGKYDCIHNIRFKIKNVDEGVIKIDSSLILEIKHADTRLITEITVFGKKAFEYVYRLSKDFTKFLK